MKTYKWLRGVLKASAFAAVMFVMQACYGAPQPFDDPNYNTYTDIAYPVVNRENSGYNADFTFLFCAFRTAGGHSKYQYSR